MIAKSFGELMRDANKAREHWLQTRRVGVAEYIPSNNTIRLHVYENNFYEIDLDRVKTAGQFTEVMFDLTDKNWANGQVLCDFIECLRHTFHEKYGKDPRVVFDCGGEASV